MDSLTYGGSDRNDPSLLASVGELLSRAFEYLFKEFLLEFAVDLLFDFFF